MTNSPPEEKGRPAEAATPALFSEEEEVTLEDLSWTDAPAFLIFWVLAFVVFLQFFTRYVLNDSLGWTEEIARYLLIGVCFVGAVIGVRKNTHIAVEFFYRYLPVPARRALYTLVDIAKIVFFVAMTLLCAKLALKTNQKMASIDLSKAAIYWVVTVAFLAMTLYALRGAWQNWRSGEAGLPLPHEPKIMD